MQRVALTWRYPHFSSLDTWSCLNTCSLDTRRVSTHGGLTCGEVSIRGALHSDGEVSTRGGCWHGSCFSNLNAVMPSVSEVPGFNRVKRWCTRLTRMTTRHIPRRKMYIPCNFLFVYQLTSFPQAVLVGSRHITRVLTVCNLLRVFEHAAFLSPSRNRDSRIVKFWCIRRPKFSKSCCELSCLTRPQITGTLARRTLAAAQLGKNTQSYPPSPCV